jgi:hypothetical protein
VTNLTAELTTLNTLFYYQIIENFACRQRQSTKKKTSQDAKYYFVSKSLEKKAAKLSKKVHVSEWRQ